MKRYVTGCKHFRDPVLETEYNSFASQSNVNNGNYDIADLDYTIWQQSLDKILVKYVQPG